MEFQRARLDVRVVSRPGLEDVRAGRDVTEVHDPVVGPRPRRVLETHELRSVLRRLTGVGEERELEGERALAVREARSRRRRSRGPVHEKPFEDERFRRRRRRLLAPRVEDGDAGHRRDPGSAARVGESSHAAAVRGKPIRRREETRVEASSAFSGQADDPALRAEPDVSIRRRDDRRRRDAREALRERGERRESRG